MFQRIKSIFVSWNTDGQLRSRLLLKTPGLSLACVAGWNHLCGSFYFEDRTPNLQISCYELLLLFLHFVVVLLNETSEMLPSKHRGGLGSPQHLCSAHCAPVDQNRHLWFEIIQLSKLNFITFNDFDLVTLHKHVGLDRVCRPYKPSQTCPVSQKAKPQIKLNESRSKVVQNFHAHFFLQIKFL